MRELGKRVRVLESIYLKRSSVVEYICAEHMSSSEIEYNIPGLEVCVDLGFEAHFE